MSIFKFSYFELFLECYHLLENDMQLHSFTYASTSKVSYLFLTGLLILNLAIDRHLVWEDSCYTEKQFAGTTIPLDSLLKEQGVVHAIGEGSVQFMLVSLKLCDSLIIIAEKFILIGLFYFIF
jgi:hypothetical protein